MNSYRFLPAPGQYRQQADKDGNGTIDYEEFKAAVEKFQSVTYDIMDVGAMKFDDDFYQFRCAIKDLDRRLSSVLAPVGKLFFREGCGPGVPGA